ncbi:fetuin-B [Ctenodactylus gundi]
MGSLQMLVFFLVSLATCCGAEFPPQQALSPSPVLSRSCSDSDVLAFADFALQHINKEREDGYVLALNRVHAAWEHRQDGLGSVFYLTLDVLETSCHVLSKKKQKDCWPRSLHDAVYGQCKIIFYINTPTRVLYLPAYNCTLRPVSPRKIHMLCPDCPTAVALSDPRVLEAAAESLAKYNRERALKQYSLVKVTRASSQWMSGPAYFVDYLIEESPRTRFQTSGCLLQSYDSEPVGLCKGFLIRRDTEKSVSVTCDFFETQVETSGVEGSIVNQSPANFPKVEKPMQGNTASSRTRAKIVPRGSVQYLPVLDNEKSQEQSPQEAFPVQLDLTTSLQGDTLDVSFLFLSSKKKNPVVLPFPREQQHSEECPGPARVANLLVLPP